MYTRVAILEDAANIAEALQIEGPLLQRNRVQRQWCRPGLMACTLW
jgi:hypothetical protein